VIVGLVDSTRLAGPAHPAGPQVYWPTEEEPPGALTFVARVRGQAEDYLTICRDAIKSADQQVAVFNAKTLDERVREVLARPRFYTTATLFFAVLAVLLAVIGIYGAASYSVAQRTHEMGVRMALGASPASVRRMAIRESLLPIIVGMIAGIGGAVASGRYLEHLIAGAEPLHPLNCAAAAAFLLITAWLASWSATARILRINPLDALRVE
jgi:putative ABC transport system permease protein